MRTKPWLWVGLGVAVVVALILGFLAFNTESRTENSATGTATAETPTRPPEASVCGLDTVTNANDLVALAPATQWDFVNGFFLAAPDSVHGPGLIAADGIVRWCYARTPTGVVFSAYNFAVMGSLVPASRFVDHTVVESTLRTEGSQDSAAPVALEQRIEPAGFRIDSYSPAVATVTIVLSVDGVLGASQMEMRWSEGDWRVMPLENGKTAQFQGTLANLAGFVPWGPHV